MLGKLRGFTNSKLAGVLVAIIIVPFVFWGMGSVFSGGNTNNIAKINNNSISTKDFIDHINRSRINPDYIKENLDNNILERILSELISKDLMSMEYKDLNVKVSDRSLKLNLQNDINFLDDDKNFSRLKYEKFLLENNIIAAEFENRLKNSQLRKRLFDYIGGGIKSPYYLQNKVYIDENKKINIQYYDLEYAYDKNISDVEINNYIIENEENLKEAFSSLYNSYKVNWIGANRAFFNIGSFAETNNNLSNSSVANASVGSSSNISPQNNEVGKGINTKGVGSNVVATSLSFFAKNI